MEAELHYGVYNSPQTVPILNQTNSAYNPDSDALRSTLKDLPIYA